MFLSDDGTARARKAVRKAFTSATIFPRTVPEMAALARHYEIGSRLSHTTAVTLLPHLGEGSLPGKSRFWFHDRNLENLPGSICWVCRAHCCILNAALRIFSDLCCDLVHWRRDYAIVTERIQRFTDVARDAELPNGKVNFD